MLKRCGVYIRVSTAEQALEGWSLDAQKAALTREAQKRGFVVADYYVDDGKSARKQLRKRQAIHRLLQDVEAGCIDVIIFKDITRWFRSVADFYAVQKRLDARGVSWIAAEQPQLNMETPDGRLQVNVLLSVGQNEADQTSERIKYVNQYLRSVNRWTAGVGSLPRGFTLDDEQHVIMDEESAPFVRLLLSEFKRTGSVNASVKAANACFPEVAASYNSCIGALRSPLLCGRYRDIEKFVSGPSYMTAEEFDDLQRRLGSNCRVTRNRVYIFSGLLICGECGRRLAGGIGGNPRIKIYRCNGYRLGRRCENSHTIAERKLERILFDYVERAVDDKIVEVRSIIRERSSRPRPADNSAQVDAALARLQDLYLNPVGRPMTREEFQKKYLEIEARRVAPVVEEEPLPNLENLEKVRELFESGVRETYFSLDELERREFWRSILKEVVMVGSKIIDIKFF